MSDSSEIIRNEFSRCENPLDVLKCQTCPEKVVENEVYSTNTDPFNTRASRKASPGCL